MPGDCRCPTRPRCWTVGRNEIADAVGDVAGSCPPLLFSCAGAAGDRNQCRCSLRGCPPSPLAAVAAGSSCPVPCATYRLLVPVLPGGRGKSLRRAVLLGPWWLPPVA